MAKLGEVCLLKAGKFVSANDISPEYNKGLYPCFGGNGIRGYVADYTHDGEFPLIGRQGALCGNVNLASGKFHATEHAVVVQPKIEMNVHWLYYALNAMNLGQYATGAAQPGLAVSKLETLSIEIPNISEQNKIAQTLCKVEQLVNFRKQQLAKLDELVKARFVEMFGDVLLNSMQWPEKTLENMADIVSGITKGRKTAEADLQEVPYMAVSNVKDGYIDWTTVKTILATRQEIEQYRLMPDDILMTEGGDPDKVGRGAIIKVPLKNSIHQNHIFRVRLDEQEILPSFFAEYLRHQKAKRYFLGCAKQTTGIASINMRQLRALPTLVPPLSLQKQFAAFVERVDQQKQTVQQGLEKLELMKKALMQEYFG